MAAEVVLGLGSNRPDPAGREPAAVLEAAIAALEPVLGRAGDPRAGPLRRASFYRTEPLHIEDQPPFVNTAVAGFYEGTPGALLREIHRVERDFGRNRDRERRWGERSLDIDILLFGDQIISEPPSGTSRFLEIPHPRLTERRFALVPLLELLPEARDPRTGLPYKTILAALPVQGIYSL
jgi:2-amino-4-hydroxy-6-hydroxymethyldihydropteridine diphosphokinase